MPPRIQSSGRKPVAPSAAMVQKCQQLAAQFRQAMAQLDYPRARQCCEQVLRMMPGNMSVLSDYALALMREGNYSQAYKTYQRIEASPFRQQASETWLDGLAEVCGWLGKTEELQRYGHRSLRAADDKFRHGQRWPLGPIKPFNTQARDKNIIAFSLYGAQPRYCETLVENIKAAAELYPHWRCRVYLDDSVPEHVWQRLRDAGAQLRDMSGDKDIFPTLWRFLVMDDPLVERFIVRDADSLVSERESAAVQAWLASPYHFHHMRDYFTHTELLLAGMWGGVNGVFPRVEPLIKNFIASYQGAERFTDQYFLKAVLWPTVRESILNHDELFHFHHAQPWPAHGPIRWQTDAFHVGSNAGYSRAVGSSTLADGARQTIALVSAGQRYSYQASVANGEWSISLPFFLAQAHQQGTLSIVAEAS